MSAFELDITARVDGREQVTTTVSVDTAAEFESLCTATVAAIERWQAEREATPSADVLHRDFKPGNISMEAEAPIADALAGAKVLCMEVDEGMVSPGDVDLGLAVCLPPRDARLVISTLRPYDIRESDATPAPSTEQAIAIVRQTDLTEADHRALTRYVQKQEAQLGPEAARIMLSAVLCVQLEIDDDAADALIARYSFGLMLSALAGEPDDDDGILVARGSGETLEDAIGEALISLGIDTPDDDHMTWSEDWSSGKCEVVLAYRDGEETS